MIDNTVRNPEPLTGETISLAYQTKMHRKLDIRAILFDEHLITYVSSSSSSSFICNSFFFFSFLISLYTGLQPRRSLSFRTCRHFFLVLVLAIRPLRAKIWKFESISKIQRLFKIRTRLKKKGSKEKRPPFRSFLRKIYINNEEIWSTNYVLPVVMDDPRIVTSLISPLPRLYVAWLHNCLVTDRETRFCDWFWPRCVEKLYAGLYVRGTRG